MARSRRSSGGSKGIPQSGGKGKGPAGWPSKNRGKSSGGGRNNAPSKRKGK